MTTTESPQLDYAAKRRQTHVEYVTWIDRTCSENPGARVALRAGLRQNINARSTFAMNRYIARWLPRNAPDATQRAYFTVAALIASRPRAVEEDEEEVPAAESAQNTQNTRDTENEARPESAEAAASAGNGEGPDVKKAAEPERWGPSLGVAFAEAVAEAPGRDREMRESTAESRLNMLTRQSASGIHRSLPASVLYLRQLDVPVDWAQLLADLIDWPEQSGRIARRWLQDYYRRRHYDENKPSGDDGNSDAPE
ncbi:type I-E CRISPR-associated protein Cse2/CasB [Streptomyces sp. DSM 44915]|uniref:Type I-E CRISPR-associated protein Cse2/CasB n=1 Tax=Streptomyces chisholmiae TaxID=3075540 RepID=A0ABU2JRV4_9ACTN|nr:type I-E CRISPR-associated protein Cse2/CasB [Streptomyces sp. DSM 44915]MDT0267652.1 type I-E CRISPR-associated protein Cse2/CasB [Streptomyces sp. DSM 44915]